MKPALSKRIAFLFATLPLTAHALTPSQVFEQVKGSVLIIKTLDAKGEQIAMGSGVLLPSGKIVTNCHVVKDGASFEAGRGKSFVPATLYAGDADKDLCLLQADKLGGTPAQIGKAASLKIGEAVYAVGAPQGLELSLSDGIVSQLRGSPIPLIQTTAAISPGSSGGGLFDSEARLVGLTTLYHKDGQSLNFAMPVEWLAEIKPGTKTVSKQRSQVDWLTRAVALEEKKDWPGLLAWGQQWNKIEPRNADAWFLIGHAHQGLNQLDPAISAYRVALLINPEYAEAWHNLGIAYRKNDQAAKAIEAFQQALRINPEFSEAWFGMGNIYSDTGQIAKAIEAYQQALRINPDHAKVWNNLGNAYGDIGQTAKAIEALQQALHFNPEYAEAWYNLGNIYDKTGQAAKAIEAYLKALRINQKYVEAWYNLGNTYRENGQIAKAIEAFKKALRINPEYASAWYNLGVVYKIDGQNSRVMDVYRQLKTVSPQEADRFFTKMVLP